MCGITGYYGIDNKNLLKSMCDSLLHRGPDDDGFYFASGIGLAMRRLSIIDLKTGKQPICNENKDIWVVFNGEIYNYTELRKDLQQKGHKFSTTSDTETIVHLYEEYGLDFVQYLRGMFGIALWDVKKKSLVLVRDRIGEKPLFYAAKGDTLFFGSEIKAILPALDCRSVDHQSVCDYLAAGFVVAPRTFYQEIKKLPPGGMIVCNNSGITVSRYWKLQCKKPLGITYRDARQKLSECLIETVGLCLKSDVEVGAFLSGGVDSSLIVALMKQHNAHVQTFSVGYEGEATGFNELHYASQVAKHLGTKHHELILGAQSSMELLPRILWHYDEPHGEPTSILVYLLCEFTRKRVKVALGGTGGDELFYGYPKHVGIRFYEYYHLIPKFLRKELIERVVARWPESTKGSRFAKRAKRFVSGIDLPQQEAYLTWTSLLQEDVRQEIISKETRDNSANPLGDVFLREYLFGEGKYSLLNRVAALDNNGYLPEYQLAYMDRMSMASSLEVRSPLCDNILVDFATSLPVNFRLKGTRTKHILKDVAKQWIPRNIVERKKVGFDSPIGQWFKGELKEFLLNFLSEEHVNKSNLLNPKAIKRLVTDHLAGEKDYSLQLWSIIALEAWYRMYIEDKIIDGTNYELRHLRGAL